MAWIPDSHDSILDHASGEKTVFTIGYNGSWGDFRCSVKGILSQLASVDFPFRFICIGKYQPDFCRWVEKYGLAGSVFMFEPVDNTQAQELLRQCDALFIHKGPPDRGKSDTHLATQAIDYVASGRLILAELPEGETVSFLRRFSGQLDEVNAKYTGEYQQQLSALYHRWQ